MWGPPADKDVQFPTLRLTFSSVDTSAILGSGLGARFFINSKTSRKETRLSSRLPPLSVKWQNGHQRTRGHRSRGALRVPPKPSAHMSPFAPPVHVQVPWPGGTPAGGHTQHGPDNCAKNGWKPHKTLLFQRAPLSEAGRPVSTLRAQPGACGGEGGRGPRGWQLPPGPQPDPHTPRRSGNSTSETDYLRESQN